MTRLSEELRSALKSAFEDIDVDKTGHISKSDIRAALQLIGQNPTLEEMTSWIENGGNGELTLKEFYDFIEQNITIKTPEQLDKDLANAFGKFKDTGESFITKEEFRKVMTRLGDEPLSENDADRLMDSLKDMEVNGRYNTEEIAKLFKR